ncbi:class I SAM-dependent methyltransferase, partial [Sulfurimonas sp.]|nr:class I SAM-dependent methyltransferase [Sulfurimonas sp.]
MSKDSISKNYIFEAKDNNLLFVGDFEGLYKNDINPWGQDGSDPRLEKYYCYSRENIVTILNQHYSKKKTLLEVGCGLGYVVDYFAKNSSFICSGVDISKTAITKAKKIFKEYEFYCYDIQKINSKKTYDVIILNQALWYVLEKFTDVFKNIYTMLNDDGIFVIVNAFTDTQNYGKNIIDGFGGLVQYIENK